MTISVFFCKPEPRADSEALTQLRRLTGDRSLSLNQLKMGKQQAGIKAVRPVTMGSIRERGFNRQKKKKNEASEEVCETEEVKR